MTSIRTFHAFCLLKASTAVSYTHLLLERADDRERHIVLDDGPHQRERDVEKCLRFGRAVDLRGLIDHGVDVLDPSVVCLLYTSRCV